MRDRLLAALALALAVTASGCYVSLHPFVTKDVEVFDPALVGAWEEKDATVKDLWVFKPEPADAPTGYIVEVTELQAPLFSGGPPKPVTASFGGRLGRFGDLLVLELSPDRKKALGPLEDHGVLASTLVPAHIVFRVRVQGDALTLMAIDPKWMDKAIASKAIKIAHEHVDADPNPHEIGQSDRHAPRSGPEGEDWVLLTAPTSELQALLRTHGKTGLFNEQDAGAFIRRK